MYFVNSEKTFDRVPRRVMQWALRKKELPEILVKAVISLYMYEGSKSKVKVGSEFSNEFSAAVGVHQESFLSPLLFAIVWNGCCDRKCKRKLNKSGFVRR